MYHNMIAFHLFLSECINYNFYNILNWASNCLNMVINSNEILMVFVLP